MSNLKYWKSVRQALTYTGVFLAGTLVTGTVALANTNYVQALLGISNVIDNGKTISSPPKLVYNGTTYVQLYSIQHSLQQAGISATWDGTNFRIATPIQENSNVQLNGTSIEKPNAYVIGGTTYVQLYSIEQSLDKLPGFGTNWDGKNFNIQTSTSSTTSSQPTAPPTLYTTKWVGYVGNVGSNAVIAGNTVVTTDADSNGAIYGYDAQTGKKLWELDQNTYYQGYLAGSSQAVLISKGNNTILALAPTTGQAMWSTSPSISNLIDYTIANGQADIASNGNEISALDATTGKVLWQKTTSGVTYNAIHANDAQIAAGTTNGHLITYTTDGLQVFDTTLPKSTEVTDIATDGNLWFVTQDQTLTAVNASGTVLWSHTFAKSVDGGTVATDNGNVYAATDDGDLTVLNAQSGKTVQTTTLPFSTFDVPVISNGRIFLATNNGLLSVLDESTLKPITSVSQYTDPGVETLSCWFAPLIYGNEVIVESHTPGYSGDVRLVAFD
jgi:outer membrane protein assembly factor BamB